MSKLFVPLLLAVSLYGQAADSDQKRAKQWLDRMITASQTLSYEGTFVYIQGQDIEVMRIAQSGDTGHQRMFSLNGRLREVVVKDDQVICWLPERRVAFNSNTHERSPFPISLPRKLDGLEKFYHFELLGQDRIAGRETQLIAIRPLDEYRYGYRLWLDQKTALVLRSGLIDETTAQPLEQLIFTDIRFKSTIDTTLLKPQYASAMVWPRAKTANVKKSVDKSVWEIAGLPSGFKKMMHQRFPAAIGDNVTEHIVVGDGLATVSIFIELLDDRQNVLLEGASSRDAMNTFGAVVDGHQIIVIGEVPRLTVEQIAMSIRPVDH